jgi:hypothetical protein
MPDPRFRLLFIKPQMLHAWRAIRVAQPVRIVWNVVETQEGFQRHPLLQAVAGGPLTGVLIASHSIARATNRNKHDLIDDVHVRPPFGLSASRQSTEISILGLARYTYFSRIQSPFHYQSD